MNGQLVHRVEVKDPMVPMEAQICATVVLDVVISVKGRVERLHVVSGPQMFRGPARKAVSQWLWKPYLVRGTPVKVETLVSLPIVVGPGAGWDRCASR